ncbi:MAG: PAS domain-containing protein [Bacteroidales bacterium]|nr:PAS domain-containing protein [Bacteroidales bacterium]
MIFGFKKRHKSSISKKVFRGYIIILLLLVLVSGATVIGVQRLNGWIESTEKVDVLLQQIYLARLETKSYSLSSDTSYVPQVDQLTDEIYIALNAARESRLYKQSRLELESVDAYIKDFHDYWTMFVQLKQERLHSEQRMDELFQSIFLAAREPFPRLLSAQQYLGNSLNSHNDLLFQLLHLKEVEKKMWNYPQDIVNPDSVKVIFKRIRALIPPEDVVAPDSRAGLALRSLGYNLTEYQNVLLKLVDDIYQLQETEDMMVLSALTIQVAGERANSQQTLAMERWSKWSKWSLLFIMITAVGFGFFMAWWFIRRVRKDEAFREAKDDLLQENRKLLNDIINNSASLIYVKDMDGRYTLINQPMEEILGVEAHRIIGRRDEDIFPSEYAVVISRNDQEVPASFIIVTTTPVVPCCL